MRFAHFVVEGPHDVSFLGRFLKARGLKLVDTKNELNPFWHPLLPTAWPQRESKGDLVKRVRVSTFFESDAWSVAVDTAESDSKIVETVIRQAQSLDHPDRIESIGVVLDADSQKTPNARFMKIRDELVEGGLPSVAQMGVVEPGPPCLGIFVLPDNANPGTLEDLLLECAQTNYPDVLRSATAHVGSVGSANGLSPSDLREFKKPAGQQKAIAGAIAAILKPGKAAQVSIQDNRWLEGQSLSLPRIKAFTAFVDALLS